MQRWQQQQVLVKESRRVEEIPQRWKQPKGEDRSKMKKGTKALGVHLAKWISVEYREEEHEKAQQKVRHLLWNRAQIEEGGNGGAVQQKRPRKDGDLQRMQRELPKERQAVRIVSTHQEEFLWQSTAT